MDVDVMLSPSPHHSPLSHHFLKLYLLLLLVGVGNTTKFGLDPMPSNTGPVSQILILIPMLLTIKSGLCTFDLGRAVCHDL